MEVCNFNQSYVRFRNDLKKKSAVTVSFKQPFTLNNVRVRLESISKVTDLVTGQTITYSLGASCKIERVNVLSGVWADPNADFNHVLASDDNFMIVKFFDQVDKLPVNELNPGAPQPDRMLGKCSEAFDRYSTDIKKVSGRLLESIPDILKALNSDCPIVSRTEF